MHFNSKEQLAGVQSIDFYLLTETANWPLVVTDTNTAGISITPMDCPLEVDGSIEPNSISIEDSPKTDSGGYIWPLDINFIYLYRGEAMEQLLEQYAGKPGICIACLNDGTRKLFGTDKEPVYLAWGNAYGEKVEDRSGIRVNIKGEQTQRPVFYKEA